MTDKEVLYVDPDAISLKNVQRTVRGIKRVDAEERFNNNIENKLGDNIEGGFTREDVKDIKNGGPAAAQIGEDKGIIVLPPDQMDTQSELLEWFVDDGDFLSEQERQAFINNAPSDGTKVMRMVGNHEGQHLEQNNHFMTLEREVDSDRTAIAQAEARGDHETAMYFKDIRRINLVAPSATHSTGAMLSNDVQPSVFHVQATYKLYSLLQLEAGFHRGLLDEDRIENPQEYFAKLHDILKEEQQEAIKNFKEEPSNENWKVLKLAEATSDTLHSYEGAYMRQIVGQKDFPEHTSTILVPNADELNYQWSLTAGDSVPDGTKSVPVSEVPKAGEYEAIQNSPMGGAGEPAVQLAAQQPGPDVNQPVVNDPSLQQPQM